MHTCEDDLVCKCTQERKVPQFNAPIYLENKQQIGKVDEIFGPIQGLVSFFKTYKSLNYDVCLLVHGNIGNSNMNKSILYRQVGTICG